MTSPARGNRTHQGLESADPLFSVILTTHSRPEWLPEAIRSVLVQTVGDFELLVIDDASEPPAEVLADPRIRLIRFEENIGLAAARNAGLDRSRGRYVTFLDDDDRYTPDRLELAALGLERAPIAICGGRYMHERKRKRRIRTLEGNVADMVLDDTTPSMAATTVRRESFPRFDERWEAVEDVDWWLRAAQQLSVATVPRTGLLIRKHDSPRWRNDHATRARENLTLLDVHAGYFAAHPRAAAFRLRRAGLLSLRARNVGEARAAFRRSLTLDRSPTAIWHLSRSLLRPVARKPVTS